MSKTPQRRSKYAEIAQSIGNELVDMCLHHGMKPNVLMTDEGRCALRHSMPYVFNALGQRCDREILVPRKKLIVPERNKVAKA